MRAGQPEHPNERRARGERPVEALHVAPCTNDRGLAVGAATWLTTSAGGIVAAAKEPVPTFEVKQVTVPLFGVVEAPDQAAWLSAFAAASATTQVQVDEAALNLIAEELELDADGLAADAERYVSGQYRAKARGMGGSRLGDLGEVLTFLMNRVPGREIVRVVSWRPGANQAVKGSRFPQPDFIVTDASGSAEALEVKSTEAFDFIALRDTPKKWTWLQPWSSVAGCRERALPQLAYVAGALTPQQHSLVVRAGKVVPFPVGKGVGAAVIAVDGRTGRLRSDPKFRTPKNCRTARRDCWSCIPSACNFVLVTMPNAPGMLSLGGAEDGPGSFLRSYERWSQALAARDLLAVSATIGPLVQAIEIWLAAASVVEPEVLRGFWGSYLGDAMRSRGIDVAVPRSLGDLSREEWNSEWSPAPVAEPKGREAAVEDIAGIVLESQDTGTPFLVSARPRSDERGTDTVSVRGDTAFLEFHLVSNTWWMASTVETNDSASTIAARLVSFALEVSGWSNALPTGAAVPLRELVAQVGDHRLRLGWESKAAPARSAARRSWIREWEFWHPYGEWRWPPWPVLLLHGDPRVRLRVTPDGRASLRVARTLLR